MADHPSFDIPQVGVERYEQYVAPIMAPFVAGLITHAEIGPGHAVLDVACGTGFAARGAALRVGDTGRVAGVDVNPAMLAAARAIAQDRGLDIDWHEASAVKLPFDDNEFDVTICQQGLQFLPDTEAALGEMARVTRPGGRVAVTVWSPLDRSAYMQAQYDALCEVAGAEAVASFLGAFRFDVDSLAAVFRSAGLLDTQVHEVMAEIELENVQIFAAGHLEALPWASAATHASPEGVLEVAQRIAIRLAPDQRRDGSTPVTFASLLAVGIV